MAPTRQKGRPSGLTRAATSSNQLHFRAATPRGVNKRTRDITPTQNDRGREGPQTAKKVREDGAIDDNEIVLYENTDASSCDQE